MSGAFKNDWLYLNEKICLCKGVSRKSVLEAIIKTEGVLAKVNRRLGSSFGNCEGRRCQGKIKEMIATYHKEKGMS